MIRALRLAAVWALALAAAILLNVVLSHPSVAPRPGPNAGVATASPHSSTAASPARSSDAIPPWIGRPPQDETRAGAFVVDLRPVGDDEALAFQAAIDRARQSFDLDALAVGVSIGGERGWSGASGLARDGVTPLDGNSPFAIGSITKTFTSALVLQLVEERRLSLGADVATVLPELGLPEDVTIGQLLSHTSGIADLLAPLRPDLLQDGERRWTPAEVLARVGGPWFAPGTGYGYSNTNYILLGLVVERITGRPFAEELSRRLLEPLDLTATGMLLEPDAPFLMRPSWASAFWTAGSMYASASDLVRWIDALYGGRVLLPGTRALVLSFGEQGYGLGAQEIEVGTRTGYGHSGLLQGFTALAVHLPEDEVTLVVIGTYRGFDPAKLLTFAEAGQPSILDLALDLR